MTNMFLHQTEIGDQLVRIVQAALPEWNVFWERDRIPDVGQVLIVAEDMDQPMSDGTHRTLQQTYRFTVRVGLSPQGDDVFSQQGIDQDVFDAIMADPYLGETCWAAQVTHITYSPYTSMEVTAKRSEVWR